MIIALGEDVKEVDGDVNTAIENSAINTYKDDDIITCCIASK